MSEKEKAEIRAIDVQNITSLEAANLMLRPNAVEELLKREAITVKPDLDELERQADEMMGMAEAGGIDPERAVGELGGKTYSYNSGTWKESEHPRDEGGKFSEIGGGRKRNKATKGGDRDSGLNSESIKRIIESQSKWLVQTGNRSGYESGVMITSEGAVLRKIGDQRRIFHFSKEMIDTLIESSKNSIVMMHNHPSGATFSLDDLALFCVYQSLGKQVVVGHKGQRYTIDATRGSRPDYEEFDRVSIKASFSAMDELAEKYGHEVLPVLLLGSPHPDMQLLYSEHHYLHCRMLASKFGWIYEEER